MDITEHRNVIIIGGGPAGAVCGYELIKRGCECLIIDKTEFPREKLCAGGLTPKTYKLLDKIYEDLEYDYYSGRKMEIYYESKHLRTYDLKDEIRIVKRMDFDNLLLEKYKSAGGEFSSGKISAIDKRNGTLYVRLKDGRIYSCDRLVGADGANGVTRPFVQPEFKRGAIYIEGFGKRREEENIKIYFSSRFRYGYMYLFPNIDGFAAGCGYKNSDSSEVRKDLTEKILNRGEKIRGAYIPMFDPLNYPFREDVVLIGDAGGYADSITGEGIYFAVATGHNAAVAITENKSFREVNEKIISVIKKINSLSPLFYSGFFQFFFRFFSRRGMFKRFITHTIDRYISKY